MSNTSIREQLRQILLSPMRSEISTSDVVTGMWSSTMLSEKLYLLDEFIATHYTPTADVAELVRAAQADELKEVKNKWFKYGDASFGIWIDSRYDKITKPQLPHKAEHIYRGNGFTHSEGDNCDDVDKAEQ